MMTKSLYIIAILAISVGCGSKSQQTAETVITDQDNDILVNIKNVLLPKAYDEQDTALLGQLLHEKYLLVDDGGVTYSKKDELAYVAQYASSYDSLAFELSRLEVFDNGTATIFGEGLIEGTDVDGFYSMAYKSTDVFVKENGEWKLISSHVSGVKEVRE